MKNFYITTAIDYPNAIPHIGHAYEKILADVLARWHRLLQEDVFYLAGLDEHGQKIEKAAEKSGKDPQTFVDDMSKHFQKMYEVLNISNNRFIRTTEKEHEKISLAIFEAVNKKGYIYKGEYEGLYCVGCERFYLERELEEAKCPIHKKECEHIKTESYFFKLSEFQEKLIEHIKQNPEFILPEARRNEILKRLEEPLRDLSISRTNFTWGITIPNDEKHVIYVWFDALLNYLSGIDYPGNDYKKYWPADSQIIGKDIIWFHTVIWPAILMAVDLPLPKTIFAHGFLTVNSQKMSKTIGNVIDPIKLVERYGADKVRYYLCREVNPKEDGDFNEENFIEVTNADLSDTLGNLLQRVIVLIEKNFEGNVPECGELTEQDKELISKMPNLGELDVLMQEYKINQYTAKVWNYISECNRYVQEMQPWKVKNEKELGRILYVLSENLRIIGNLIEPIIPESAFKLEKQIGQKITCLSDCKFRKDTKGKIEKSGVLFKKEEKKHRDVGQKESKEQQEKNEKKGHEDPFSRLNLKLAKILEVKDHPEADKLYLLRIQCDGERQLVAGMKEFYSKEELEGKTIVVVSNLKAAKLRGEKSEGMMLAAEKGKTVKVLEAEGLPGDTVYIEGIDVGEDEITIKDFMEIKLKVDDGKVFYEGKELRTKKGPIKVEIEDGAKIR